MIKAIIFDWGGVIAPNPNGGWMNVLMDMLDISYDELRPHWHAAGYEDFSKGLITEELFWLQFEKSFDKPLNLDTSRVWRDGSALTPYPEIMEFIETLHAKGLKTAVLSNTVKPLSSTLRNSGLYDSFDAVILSDEVGDAKPDRSMYERTVQALDVRPSDCIYIDDLEKNLAPANRLGMITVLADENPANTIAKVESLL